MLERARQDWRDMKVRFLFEFVFQFVVVHKFAFAIELVFQVKKKAKWIRKAMKEFRDYEEKVVDFKAKHPEFNPPSVKSFLTQEEQKILDK